MCTTGHKPVQLDQYGPGFSFINFNSRKVRAFRWAVCLDPGEQDQGRPPAGAVVEARVLQAARAAASAKPGSQQGNYLTKATMATYLLAIRYSLSRLLAAETTTKSSMSFADVNAEKIAVYSKREKRR